MTRFREQLSPTSMANILEKHTGNIWATFQARLGPLDFIYLHLASSVEANRRYYLNEAIHLTLRPAPTEAAGQLSILLALCQETGKTWTVEELETLQIATGLVLSIFTTRDYQPNQEDKAAVLAGLTQNPNGFIRFLSERYAQLANSRPPYLRGKLIKKGESVWTDFYLTLEQALKDKHLESSLNQLYTQTITHLLADPVPNRLLATELQAVTTTDEDRILTTLLLPLTCDYAWDEAWSMAAAAMEGTNITPALHAAVIQFIKGAAAKGTLGHSWSSRALNPYYRDLIAGVLPTTPHPAYEKTASLGLVAAHLDRHSLTDDQNELEIAGDVCRKIKKHTERIAALQLLWQVGRSHTDLLALMVATAGQTDTHQLFIQLLGDTLQTGNTDLITNYGELFDDKITFGSTNYDLLVRVSNAIKIIRCHLTAKSQELGWLADWLAKNYNFSRLIRTGAKAQ